MRIALLVNHLGLTGVNNVVLDLSQQLKAHGHECTVFYLKETDKPMSFPCETRRVEQDIFNTSDVVHAHGLLPEIWVFKNKPKVCKALCVTTLHCYCFQDLPDLYGPIKGNAMALIYLWMKRPFDRVVCLSKDMMEYYGRWISKSNLTFAYNTRLLTETESVRNSYSKPNDDQVVIGMTGVLIQRKGVDLMLKALSLLPERFVLCLAGDGKDRNSFEAMADELGINHRVTFLGHVDKAWQLLPQYDILALPSRSEGFPLALLEAAVYGKKVVVSNLPIVRECFQPHIELEVFDINGGAEALKDAILRAEKNTEMATGLKEAYDKKYSPQCFYERYMNIYKEKK